MLKRRRPTLDVEGQGSLSYEMAVPDLDLNRAFDRLSPEERLTITLYYYEGYDTREIAKLTEVSEGTVRSRLSRGRSSLRAMLQEKEAAK
jgi:RNA polymerase sigma-70 factor (ECF subfamily)